MTVEKTSESVIKRLNMDLKEPTLLVVVGSVGAGKTTLLYSILEETILTEGEMSIKGKIAYVE